MGRFDPAINHHTGRFRSGDGSLRIHHPHLFELVDYGYPAVLCSVLSTPSGHARRQTPPVGSLYDCLQHHRVFYPNDHPGSHCGKSNIPWILEWSVLTESQQASPESATLGPINLVWDRIQLTVFFVQETILSTIYVVLTWRHLKNFSIFGLDGSKGRQVMKHLIFANLVVIFLDIALLAI